MFETNIVGSTSKIIPLFRGYFYVPNDDLEPLCIRVIIFYSNKQLTMKQSDKNEIIAVKKIHQKILEVYPFLTKAEKNTFDKKSKKIIDKFLKGDLKTKQTVESLLLLFKGNGHATINEWHKLSREFIKKLKDKASPTFSIESRVLFIKIPSWFTELGEIDKKLVSFCQKNSEKYDTIVIDVRENHGGNSKIAYNFSEIFFKKTIEYGQFVKKNKRGKLKTNIGKLKPNKNIFIDKPIAILISNKCFSSNELFLAPFKISKRAVLIGETTAGGSANPVAEIIKIDGKKYVVRIPTWRFFLKGKIKPIENTKITPDITYKGRDINKFAKEYLLKVLKK